MESLIYIIALNLPVNKQYNNLLLKLRRLKKSICIRLNDLFLKNINWHNVSFKKLDYDFICKYEKQFINYANILMQYNSIPNTLIQYVDLDKFIKTANITLENCTILTHDEIKKILINNPKKHIFLEYHNLLKNIEKTQCIKKLGGIDSDIAILAPNINNHIHECKPNVLVEYADKFDMKIFMQVLTYDIFIKCYKKLDLKTLFMSRRLSNEKIIDFIVSKLKEQP